MSEELKLLRAMCDALGLEVKREFIVTKVEAVRFPDEREYEYIGDGKHVEVKREVVYTVIKGNE